MITLTFAVPNPDVVIAAGFPSIRVLKSTTQTAAGPFTGQVPLVTLVAGVTSYLWVDVNGAWGDYYETTFYNGGTDTSSNPSAPQPGWLSDMCNSVRDLLGVGSDLVSDATIQGMGILPAALSTARNRVPTLDAIIAAEGDLGNLALAALAHLCARLLCPRLTVVVLDGEKFGDYSYQRQRQMDWNETAQSLADRYELLISQVAGDSADNPNSFGVNITMAGPTTSGVDTTGGLRPFSPVGGYQNPQVPFDPNFED